MKNCHDKKYVAEISKHFIIKISQYDKIKLFLTDIFNSAYLSKFFGNQKYVKLMKEGHKKIDKYTNIIKLIKTVKTSNFLQKHI